MSGTTAINALRYPTLSDSPNAQTAVQNLASDLDPKLVPVYSTTGNRDSAITAPTQGQVAFVTGTGELYRYNGSLWVGAIWRDVYKNAIESVTSSTAMQDDQDLFLSVEANSTYVARLTMQYDGATAGDMKFQFNLPAGSTAYGAGGTALYLSTADVLNLSCFAATDVGSCGAGGVGSFRSLIVQNMMFQTSSTAGTCKIQWAQVVSNATATRVDKGGVLSLLKVG